MPKNLCFWTVVLEKTLESPLHCKIIKPVSHKGNQSWIFFGRTDVEAETPNILTTWCKELTHLKRPWCWERLRAGGAGDNRGWDGWITSPTQWTWVWVDYGSWWWTWRPGVLWFMWSQRVGHNWVTELNWTELNNMFSNTVQTEIKRCFLLGGKAMTKLGRHHIEKQRHNCFFFFFNQQRSI